MVCGEIECGSQHVGCAVDRRRGKLVGEPISPHSEIARGYEGNTPFCQRVRKMSTHARDIAHVAAANPEVTLVYVESLGDGRRIIRHIAVAAMLSHNAGAVLRLPKSEHSLFGRRRTAPALWLSMAATAMWRMIRRPSPRLSTYTSVTSGFAAATWAMSRACVLIFLTRWQKGVLPS